LLLKACAQAVDFYLDEEYSEEKKAIVQLSTLTPAEAREKGVDVNVQIMGYIREAQSEWLVMQGTQTAYIFRTKISRTWATARPVA
jgi:hypothetical protein